MPLPDYTTEEMHEKIDADREAMQNSLPDKDVANVVKRYRDYAVGKQRNTVSPGTEQFLAGLSEPTVILFSDNVTDQAISDNADRLELLRFEVEDDRLKPQRNAEKDFLRREVWIKNNLSSLQRDTHRSAIRDGNFYLLPSWNAAQNRIVITKEPCWDGESGMFLAYDDFGLPLYAAKEWQEVVDKKAVWRRVVYLEDRIERYRSEDGHTWIEYVKRGEDAAVQPWRKRDGSPLHIPVIHFPNADKEIGLYGASAISGGFLGNQDSLNDKRYDIDVAARMTAFQMYTATNFKPERTTAGAIVPLTIGPGAFLFSLAPEMGEESINSQFGVLPAGDIGQLIDSYSLVLRAMCRMTRTPLHAITGDWPSGEALLRAELPAINKANAQKARFEACWASLAHRCTEIANAFGDFNLNEDALITAVFAPTSQLGELQKAMADSAFWEGANKAIAAGYPLEMYLRDHDWPEEKIKAFLKARDEEERRQQEMEASRVAEISRLAGDDAE
jgi:hypothetical protein